MLFPKSILPAKVDAIDYPRGEYIRVNGNKKGKTKYAENNEREKIVMFAFVTKYGRRMTRRKMKLTI